MKQLYTYFTLISLNIERQKHLDLIIPFLKAQQPDIVCLQEVMEEDLPLFKDALGAEAVSMNRVIYKKDDKQEVVAILSQLPIISHQQIDYEQFTQPIPELIANHDRPAGPLLSAKIDLHGNPVNIATTHFTWSPNGEINNEQRTNAAALLKQIDTFPDLVLCGDFNTPRGKEVYSALANRLKDNIPADATTTIDENFHRAGKLDYVVDGLFTSPKYKVTDVKLQFGLSDHAAILATVRVNSQ